jgi:hypothetical protein
VAHLERHPGTLECRHHGIVQRRGLGASEEHDRLAGDVLQVDARPLGEHVRRGHRQAQAPAGQLLDLDVGLGVPRQREHGEIDRSGPHRAERVLLPARYAPRVGRRDRPA